MTLEDCVGSFTFHLGDFEEEFDVVVCRVLLKKVEKRGFNRSVHRVFYISYGNTCNWLVSEGLWSQYSEPSLFPPFVLDLCASFRHICARCPKEPNISTV